MDMRNLKLMAYSVASGIIATTTGAVFSLFASGSSEAVTVWVIVTAGVSIALGWLYPGGAR